MDLLSSRKVDNYRKRVLWLSCLLTLGIGVGAWQDRAPQGSSQGDLRDRIATLINQGVHQGEGVIDGVKTWSRVPPSSEALEEIRRYGDDAVPALAKHLNSQDERERALAVEFLGMLGGRRVVALQDVIRHDASPSLRIRALGWISQTPWELAAPVIRDAESTAPNKKVREAARDLLAHEDPE